MAREWTTTEIQVLRYFAALGAEGVAQLLERSKASVEARAKASGISLRATGDDVDLDATPARLLRYVRKSPSFTVCPMCGKRLAMMVSTGMCRVCHLDRLIELRSEQLDIVVREKRLAKLRQDKKRMRVCVRCSAVFYPRADSTTEVCGGCAD